MSKFIATRGLPGSGKTTWAEEFLKSVGAPGGMIVERDKLRGELFSDIDGIGTPDQEKQVTKAQYERIRMGLRFGLTVISSDTNLDDKRLRTLIGIAEDEEADVVIKDFRDVPLDVCLERNLNRSRHVPEDVIRNMYTKYVKGRDLSIIPEAFKLKKAEFDFDAVEKYVAPKSGVPTYICD